MKLDKIITLANAKTEMAFTAMIRSLRATGCHLPVWVIPYDNDIFILPENCIWWEVPELITWVKANNMWPAFRKIQCFTTTNYQFVDSDIIFFKNPEEFLKDHTGFITSCTHWSNPGETITDETLPFFKNKSSTWPKLTFNSGQWACDEKLYEIADLKMFCENNYKETLFLKTEIYKDQAGINLLVNHTDIGVTNLTLPPINMNSTWAGDYTDANSFLNFEARDKPYLIHWAGTPVNNDKYINSYLFSFLEPHHKSQFLDMQSHSKKKSVIKSKLKQIYRIIKH
jgi:hypothetical protein